VEGLGRGAYRVKCGVRSPKCEIQIVSDQTVIANGKPIVAKLPCSLEAFLAVQRLLPRSVVVEHNGEAVAPSEFSRRTLHAGDRLEIVKIVAGG
jgi:thiamine biosynthesis protein ThiS